MSLLHCLNCHTDFTGMICTRCGSRTRAFSIDDMREHPEIVERARARLRASDSISYKEKNEAIELAIASIKGKQR